MEKLQDTVLVMEAKNESMQQNSTSDFTGTSTPMIYDDIVIAVFKWENSFHNRDDGLAFEQIVGFPRVFLI